MDKHAYIDLYILEAYNARFSGYNTFREEFLKGIMQNERFHLHIVLEESPIEAIKEERKNAITYLYLPKINQNKFEVLESYLKAAIKPTPKMVFFSNFFPAIFNVKAIKKLFPQAKIIHIIHDFPWLSIFLGNETLYMDYIHHNKKNRLSPQEDRFVRYCTYDIMESFQSIDKVVSLCETTAGMLKDFYLLDPEKICLIPNGMEDYTVHYGKSEPSSIKQKYHLPQDGLLIVMVGRLTRPKGADRIFELLNRIDPSIKYYLIYAGEDDIYKWIPSDRADSVLSLGFKNRSEMMEIYSVSDLGLFPSRHEQCSYVGIELLMYNIPVITTPSYGVKDMFHAENSIVISDSQKVITLKEIESKKGAARDAYLKNYTSERMGKDYRSLIRELIISGMDIPNSGCKTMCFKSTKG